MKSRPLGWHAFANLSYDGFWEMRVWAFQNASLGSLAVVSDAKVLSEYMCGEQCVSICVCIRVLLFTAHVCGVLLCVQDRALHRVALAHGVFDRRAQRYKHTHMHTWLTQI